MGLIFAISIKELMGEAVQVRVQDARWCKCNGRIAWCGPLDGNVRRQQVSTLQSRQYSLLPGLVLERLFVENQYEEMWPIVTDSPKSLGRPRNVRVRHVEDVLLRMAQDVYDVELVAGRYVPSEDASGADVIVIAEGPNSATREYYIDRFGEAIPGLYSLNGRQIVETVIGLEVESTLTPGETVLLTIANNRFLLNSLNGRGFLNVRLTDEEAREVVGIGPSGYEECIQSRPCLMVRSEDSFRCPTHGTVFKPPLDPHSFLWPRIKDGLRLFGVEPEKLLAVTAFRLSMVHRPKFSAELVPGKFGFLIGDAANALHFWPGRGLNSGIPSAVSLARCLASRWKGHALRDADFTVHEGLMHMLQHRHKSRAFRTMLMADERGVPRPLRERVRAGLTGPFDPAGDIERLMTRLSTLRDRLVGRMDDVLTLEELRARLRSLGPSTLKVLVETGPWITTPVAGEEVDLNMLFPAGP